LASHFLPDIFCKGFLCYSFHFPLFPSIKIVSGRVSRCLLLNKQIEINKHLSKQASKLLIYFYLLLLIRAKKAPILPIKNRTRAIMLLRCHLTSSKRMLSAMYQHTCSAITCSHVFPTLPYPTPTHSHVEYLLHFKSPSENHSPIFPLPHFHRLRLSVNVSKGYSFSSSV